MSLRSEGKYGSPRLLHQVIWLDAGSRLRQKICCSTGVIRYRWGSGADGNPWRFFSAKREVAVPIMEALTANDPALALRAGVDGLGIVQLPEIWMQPFVAEGRLIKILDKWTLHSTEFCLFHSSRRHVPIKLRALVDFLRNESKAAANCDGDRSVARNATVRGHQLLKSSTSVERANVNGFRTDTAKSAPYVCAIAANGLTIAGHSSACDCCTHFGGGRPIA